MNLKSTIPVLLVSTCFLLPTQWTRADLAMDFEGTVQNGFQADATFGWAFTVNSTITVDGLGFFDDFLVDGQGLIQDHVVAIWNDTTDALLAQTTIDNTSMPVSSTAMSGQWMFNAIAPLTLNPGEYVIGAHDPACSGPDCDRIRLANIANTISAITLGNPRTGVGFSKPGSSNDVEDGYFGPTFRIASVPEPGSLALLTGMLFCGLMQRRRQATRKGPLSLSV